jgi:hypothetical protein
MSDTEKKAKYRIRIESLDGEEIPAEAADGIECESFALLTDNGDMVGETICNMSVMGLAGLICKGDNFAQAAIIARGIIEARSVHRSRTLSALVDDLINN